MWSVENTENWQMNPRHMLIGHTAPVRSVIANLERGGGVKLRTENSIFTIVRTIYFLKDHPIASKLCHEVFGYIVEIKIFCSVFLVHPSSASSITI